MEDFGLSDYEIMMIPGVTIAMANFEQRLFLIGSLEGRPTTKTIRRRRKPLESQVKSHFGAQVLLSIEPEILLNSTESSQTEFQARRFGRVCRYHNVACIAKFVKPDDHHRYAMLAMWFQEHFGLDIPEYVLNEIRIAEWTKYCYPLDP